MVLEKAIYRLLAVVAPEAARRVRSLGAHAG